MKRDPRNFKYKRTFLLKNKVIHIEPSMSSVQFLTYGLVVQKDVFLYYEQLFTIFRLLKKYLKKKFYFKINYSCILPFTKKPVSARMGKGKGAWKGFNVFLRKGSVLCEVGNLEEKWLLFLLKACSLRLPVKTKIIQLKI